jgi:putative NADH-flavin reductase
MTYIYPIARLVSRAAVLVTLFFLPTLVVNASTIVVYGATGNLGERIVTEALSRGHEVLGVSRDASSLTFDHENFSATAGDVTDLESMLEIIPVADVVIISVGGNGPDNTPENSIVNLAALTFIEAARTLGDFAPRVIQMGGGSTLRSNGVLRLDSMTAEEGTSMHGRIFGHWNALESYRATVDVRWTVITPPPGPALNEGDRTGLFRVGEDEIVVGADGQVSISRADLAVAYINEVENPRAIGKRITLGY